MKCDINRGDMPSFINKRDMITLKHTRITNGYSFQRLRRNFGERYVLEKIYYTQRHKVINQIERHEGKDNEGDSHQPKEKRETDH